MTDSKIVDRIKKLLAMTESRGATEAEAAVAAAKIQEMLEEHGLEMAQIDLEGGAGERRTQGRAGAAGFRRERWSETLMRAVAESCFVEPIVLRDGPKVMGFALVGRESAVVSAEVLYDYLSGVVVRLASQCDGSWSAFRFGCAERLASRLEQRHRERLDEQRRQATVRAATGETAGALVIVLEDYAQRERDLNNDYRRGVAPGTTKGERDESERKFREEKRRISELQAQGKSWDVAWWMVAYDMSEEQAIAQEERLSKVSVQEPPKSHKKQRQRYYVDFDERRRQHPDYRRGSRAADDVSLDQQIDADKRRLE